MRKWAKGFTLIELMIVVAIIGILASVAIPRFLTFKMRSTRSEAKLNLFGASSAMNAFRAEKGHYTANLVDLGWHPDGAPRYIYGFLFDSAAIPSTVRDTATLASTIGKFNSANMVDYAGTPLTLSELPGGAVGRTKGTGCALTVSPVPLEQVDGFTMTAVGNLDRDAELDQMAVVGGEMKVPDECYVSLLSQEGRWDQWYDDIENANWF